jgi:hypothetical protein
MVGHTGNILHDEHQVYVVKVITLTLMVIEDPYILGYPFLSFDGNDLVNALPYVHESISKHIIVMRI